MGVGAFGSDSGHPTKSFSPDFFLKGMQVLLFKQTNNKRDTVTPDENSHVENKIGNCYPIPKLFVPGESWIAYYSWILYLPQGEFGASYSTLQLRSLR